MSDQIELPIVGDPDGEEDHPEVVREFDGDVTIRARMSGVAMYAVYDGEEQVSEEIGPLNDEELMWWVEGYVAAKDTEENDD